MQYLNEGNAEAMRITTGKFCRRCGAAIPSSSPQHSCGACLLETALGPNEAEREEGGSASPKTINAFGLPAEALAKAENAFHHRRC